MLRLSSHNTHIYLNGKYTYVNILDTYNYGYSIYIRNCIDSKYLQTYIFIPYVYLRRIYICIHAYFF